MPHKIRTFSALLGLLSLLWAASCSTLAPTTAPTPDLDPVRTEAAATVYAQVTHNLALTPSITPIPSATPTTRPTQTPRPSATPTSTKTAAPTSGTPSASSDNKAQWVSQTIADDTIFTPGETFTMTWRLKNTGITTWTAGYMLRYYSGATFGATKEIKLGQEVLPGSEIDITVLMKAPTTLGTYRSDWVMATESRSNFKEPVYLKIKVMPAPTATPKP